MKKLMEKLKRFALVLVLPSLIGAKSSFVTPKIHDDTTRIASVQQWLAGVDRIAKKVNDSRVNEIQEYVKRNYIIAKPTKFEDLTILTKGHNITGESFAIVPLYPEEKNLPVVKNQNIRVRIGAEYIRETKTPWIVNHENVSNVFMGAMLIHEGEHILQDKDPRFAKHSQLTYCVGEYFAFTTSLNALRAFGGIKYEELLQQDVEKMIKEYQKNGKFVIRLRYDHRYDMIFGKPSSKYEEEVRALDIVLTCVILAIRRLIPKGDHHFSESVATFCSYYASINKLPFNPNSW